MNERIKELRKRLGLTLEKFGDRLGVGKTAINKLEKGENNVTDQMFKSICREFNVSEEWLRTGEGEMFLIPDDEDAALVSDLLENTDDDFYRTALDLIRTYKQLQPESQEVLRNLCRQFAEKSSRREI